MIGVTSYAAYLPAYRIARDEIAAAWQSRSLGGRKCAIRFDEDSLTMAAAAAQACLAPLDRGAVHALFFASTTAPFAERLNAGLIAAFCDLPANTATADISTSLRAGTTALGLGLYGVQARPGDTAIVAAADMREAVPGSDEEQLFGDAAAAVALGTDGVLAELVGAATRYDDFFDAVRRDRDTTVVSYASKFSTERGYQKNLGEVIGAVLKKASLAPADVRRLVLSSPDRNAHAQLAKKLGFAAEQVQETGWEGMGLAGCAMPLVLLAAALEASRPGDLILVGAHGDGADALLFRATDRIREFRSPAPLAPQRDAGVPYASYSLYRKAREYGRAQEDSLEISNVFYAREEAQNVRLHGIECRRCGVRQLPQARLCTVCHKGDEIVDVPLARTGKVFTFAVDHLYPSPIPPTVMAVVDLEGGGRIYCEVADVDPARVEIGMPVELTIRRLKEGGGLHHYFWKCRPRRSS